MKVGDLVTLSAYGKKVKRTGWVQPDDFGIIKGIRGTHWTCYDIHWSRSCYSRRVWEWEEFFDRRDIKFVKKRAKQA